MKAIEILEAVLREGLSVEPMGIFYGANLIDFSAERYFKAEFDSGEILPSFDYLYYYGFNDSSFCFLQDPDAIMVGDDENTYVYLWKIENN